MWQPLDWKSSEYNCYNFALNKGNRNFLQPGGLSGAYLPGFCYNLKEYLKRIHKNAMLDGLRYMGYSLYGFSRGETPVALFVSAKRGFHWFALRKEFETDLRTSQSALSYNYLTLSEKTKRAAYVSKSKSFIWAHKYGEDPAEKCLSSIFNVAALLGYGYFGGYYAVPENLAGGTSSFRKAGQRRIGLINKTPEACP
jgi:hypothetical protein